MTDRSAEELTRVLGTLAGGDASAAASAAENLLPTVYDELHRLASSFFRGQPTDHTLQPTALVHEAFLRLAGGNEAAIRDRAHFVAVAAVAMRQILINHARGRSAEKRGGGRRAASLDDERDSPIRIDADLIALDDALSALAQHDARKAKVVELRFFGRMTHPEIAEALRVAKSTVDLDWRFARAWLVRELGEEA